MSCRSCLGSCLAAHSTLDMNSQAPMSGEASSALHSHKLVLGHVVEVVGGVVA